MALHNLFEGEERFKAEPWKLSCFSEKEIGKCEVSNEDTETCLTRLAEEKAERIVAEKAWDDFIQLPPRHDAPYGLTIFKKEKKEKFVVVGKPDDKWEHISDAMDKEEAEKYLEKAKKQLPRDEFDIWTEEKYQKYSEEEYGDHEETEFERERRKFHEQYGDW